MGEYRIYYLDGLNHVRAVADIDAESDDQALAAAREGQEEAVELWRLDRFLCRFEPIEVGGDAR